MTHPKALATALLLSMPLAILPAVTASAGVVERACLKSDRKAASRSLCGCIQDVADISLSGSDQKTAASLFADPQKSQDIRQSDNRSNETFWLRYKKFGEQVEMFCS